MKRIVIFAHFDQGNIIDSYVIRYLMALKKITPDIIFSSDCNLADSEIRKLDGICIKVLAQKHGEYDFGSHKRGLENLDLSQYDELLLINDSCYLIGDLEVVFSSMEKSPADFWGMTQNRKIKEHIQSYFMAFRKKVFLHEEFLKFYKNIKIQEDKKLIIANYEAGLSKLLLDLGFKKDSFIKKIFSHDVTCSHLVFSELLDKKFSLIKIGLLKLNYRQIPQLCRWKNYVKAEDIKLIENHLERIIKTKAPSHWFLERFKMFDLVRTGEILRVKIFGVTVARIKKSLNKS
jgi:rhamnosyltransferase